MFLRARQPLPQATSAKCVLAASSTLASWSLPPDDAYDAFQYYLTTAFAGHTPSGYPVNADDQNNPDGHVSVLDAFEHAKNMDKTLDKPALEDAKPPIAARMTLWGMLP